MNQSIQVKSTCTKCSAEVDKKALRPEHWDVNTQSLLLMFGLREIAMVECPKCSTKRMLI